MPKSLLGSRTPPLSAVIFDLDGTLVDSIPLARYAFEEAFRRCGVPGPPPTDEFIAGAGRELRNLLAHLDLPQEMASVFAAVSREHAEMVTEFAGARRALAMLRRAGVKISVLTGKDRDRSEEILSRLDLSAFVDVTVTGSDGIPCKPAPDGITWILEACGSRPGHSVLVGDSAADMIAARSSGIEAVGCTWGGARSEVLLAAGADLVVDDWRGLMAHLRKRLPTLAPG